MVDADRAQIDFPYGQTDRQRLDLFHPVAKPLGLLVFVHGGYWLSFDKSYWSHFARGAVNRGFAVAVPSYRLCPEVRIGTIAEDIAAAVNTAAGLVDGPVMLAGHSAGGQLVARLATRTTPLSEPLRHRLRRVTPISGLHDLRPLMRTAMNKNLQIDENEANNESPALLLPLPGVTVTAWVGTDERPEFVRQSEILGQAWPNVDVRHVAGRHHFNILDPLCDANSPLTKTVLGL